MSAGDITKMRDRIAAMRQEYSMPAMVIILAASLSTLTDEEVRALIAQLNRMLEK